ncbi:Lsr2 family DNA-binding protein [Actinomadura alba]|uniref:Lsr2 family protein n=1 Tax=Actinomadura alba TaxID=406431 RepID=A0ABR7LUJ0_9ACTN|nr:(d)CMP kinase [Actinomadura alba]MBC6468512.1 Lsr2 family protein [Actinomadura alba]
MKLRPFSDHPRGVFITIDGPSGAGKSTIVHHLAQQLVAEGEDVHVTVVAEVSSTWLTWLGLDIVHLMSDPYEQEEWESDAEYARGIAIREHIARLRAWAAENGIKVRPSGRIPFSVQQQYTEATGDDLAAILEQIPKES